MSQTPIKSQKPYHSPTLDEIRQRIDQLDTRIHETLMERADLVLKIGEEKRKNNIEIVQPAREARMIRRLLARHEGALPQMAVVRIWRELVGAVSLLQTGLKVCVADTDKHPQYWDLAKDYFGSCLPMIRAEDPLAAVKAVREGRVNFAVLPYPTYDPEQEEIASWWENLDLAGEQPLRVIVRLPHGDDPSEKNPDYRALVVSRSGFDSSDDDNSFIYLECPSEISRAKILSAAEKSALKPLGLTSKPSRFDPALRNHFLEVEGFYDDRSAALKKLVADLGEGIFLKCAGGYPVPPVYSKTIVPQKPVIPSAPKDSSTEKGQD